MKIQLVREEKINGILYSVEVDGKYVRDSCSTNEEEAVEIFEKIVANKGKFPSKTILITTTISDDEQTKKKAD